MKSNIESLTNLQKKLTIEVPIETVRTSFQKAYAGMQKKATIKGFRKGKAPIAMIRDMYQEKVTPDVLNNLINDGYFAALGEHKINPIDMPEINVDQFSEEDGLKFSATVELRPEVELKSYEGLKIQKEKLNISETKVLSVIEDIRRNQAEVSPVVEDRPAQEGDIAVIDFEGFIGDAPLENGAGKDQDLELGANQFIPGFEEGVVGMKIGSNKELNLKFPEQYHAKDIAGKDVTFKVTLSGLKKKTLPEVNDEFAKKVGEHENLDALKEAIRGDIKNGEEDRIKNELKDRVLKALVAANPVEVPPSMQKKQKDRLVEDLKARMQQQGMGQEQFEEYKKQWDGDFDETASAMIQSSFLVGALAEKHDLHAKDEDFEKKMQEYAAQIGLDIDKIKEFYGKPEQRGQIDFQITEDKVVSFLMEKANVEEVDADQLKKDKK